MFRIFIPAAFLAVVALAPVAAQAEMKPSPAAPSFTTAQTQHPDYHRPTTRSHKSEMRSRNNMSRERARAGAEHARKARQH